MADRPYINGGPCDYRRSNEQMGQSAAGGRRAGGQTADYPSGQRYVPAGYTPDQRPLRRGKIRKGHLLSDDLQES